MTIVRTNWTREEISEIYQQPILNLVYQAATVHREFHDPQEVQVCTLLSVKTGGCPEDCSYCPQAARYHTDVKVQKLMEVEEVLGKAMDAFYHATVELGLAGQVTTFTQSEFNRTFQTNGSGTDHAWGSHQIVLGGAVKGGVYGALPTFAFSGPDDANGRGVWIPKISTAQFGGTLGKWFGATPQDLLWAFPTLANFPATDIGFMKP